MRTNKLILLLLKNIPIVLFVIIFLFFGIMRPDFLSFDNFLDILTAVAYVGILATGMTFVILTGGIDLSIGSIVYISSLIPALLMRDFGFPIWISLIIGLIIGALFGAFNAFFIVKMKMLPFIVTLATMVAGKGLSILLCQSQGVRFPDSITKIASTKLFGVIPLPILILAVVVGAAVLIERKTPIGRRIYAIGNDEEVARKAGINSDRVKAFVYILNGLFAAVGSIMLIIQLGGLVNPSTGEGVEFQAISAAVLGGASLAGGIGSVFPGTLIGAMIIKMLDAGLIYLGTDVYFQPIVSAMVIFIAVLIDSLRTTYIRKLESRNIRVEEDTEEAEC